MQAGARAGHALAIVLQKVLQLFDVQLRDALVPILPALVPSACEGSLHTWGLIDTAHPP